jgi:hypothetical protein
MIIKSNNHRDLITNKNNNSNMFVFRNRYNKNPITKELKDTQLKVTKKRNPY